VPGSRRIRTLAAAGILVAASLTAPALTAVGASADSLVTADPPATNTPNIVPGTDSAGTAYEVYAMTQVGSQIVVAGEFTQALPPGDRNVADAVQVHNVMAFDQATGTINANFRPVLSGGSLNSLATSLLPGPVVNGDPTVYVGGNFNTVNGTSAKYLALLDTTNGQLVTTFAPKLDGAVNAIVLAGGRLIAGGVFTHALPVGSQTWVTHQGLAALDPSTGALDPYMQVQTGTTHHSYTGVAPNTAFAPVGVKSMALTPDGTKLFVDGNFKNVTDQTGAAYLRDQIMLIDLGATSSAIDPNWATQELDAACYSNSEDSYVRGMAMSPDGSYFVVTASGGDGTNADGTKGLCDSASRWETGATGTNVQPTWVDWTGRDSLYSVQITADAVYVGGHERWMNNSNGHDSPGPGAVPRAGVAALDPSSGVPYAWNPGRTPRGAGTYSLLATSSGLYTGADTAYWGPGPGSSPPQYYRGLVAFFPTGGETLPAESTASLPANVYLAGPSGNPTGLSRQYYDGTTASAPVAVADPSSLNWSQVRGMVLVGNKLFYGYSDGNFYERSFDGVNLGPPTALDPAPGSYDDPAWDNLPAGGNGGYNYQGKLPTFYGTDIPTVTGMIYFQGRLYYAQAGKAGLRYRNFTPDDGVVGSDKCIPGSTAGPANTEPCVFDVPSGAGQVNFSNTTGMFLSGSTLYYSDSTGNLHSVAWNNGYPLAASDTIVSGPGLDGRSWKSDGMFVLPPSAPTAAFTGSCTATTCSFDASASTAPGSSIASYTWDFGDQTTPVVTPGPTAAHSYANPGTYPVTVTVANAQGATASTTQPVSTTAIPPPTASFTSACTGLACSFDGSASTAPGSSITSYAWTFGDGNTASGTTATDGFAAAGTYPVTLTVTNAQGQTGTSTQQVSVAQAPTASFADYCTALGCTFDASASTAPGSSIVSYAWAFGDGSTGTTGPGSPTTTHNYPAAGTYTVTLTVTSSVGGTDTTSSQVTVAPAPVPSFTAACSQFTCAVNGAGSTAPGSSVATYTWTFGDGSAPVLTTSPTAGYTYAGAGSYPITLTVTNALGTSASTTQTVVPGPTTAPIGFVGSVTTNANATTESVVTPAGVAAGNGLILIATSAANAPQTAPAGWTLVGTQSNSTMYTSVWERVAAGTDAGSKVTVTFGTSATKGTLQLLAYSGTSASGPVLAARAAATTGSVSLTSYPSPTTTIGSSGAWVVSFWAARSSAITTWTAPASQSTRGASNGSGGGHVNSLASDGGQVQAPGAAGGLVATTDQAATSAVSWTLVLAPSP
jgi:PKD repeat protein